MARSGSRNKGHTATTTATPTHSTASSGKSALAERYRTSSSTSGSGGMSGDRQRRSHPRKSRSHWPCYVAALSIVIVLAAVLWSWARRPPQAVPGSASHNLSVYDRGLVKTYASYESILSVWYCTGNTVFRWEFLPILVYAGPIPIPYIYLGVHTDHSLYWTNASHRHFHSSVLAYITPWNGKGYDMAKIFRAKFTHISPVWYQLKSHRDGIHLEGKHNVDKNWIKDVRQGGFPLIVPRVVLEGRPLDLLMKPEEREKAITLLMNEILEMQFDGIVLEAWSLWRAHGILDQSNLRMKALEFVKVLGLELHSRKFSHVQSNGKLTFIFVIPPPGSSGELTSFTTSDMLYLNDAVDGFSLMTYDYSSPYAPGPNAPLPWIRQCLHQLFPAGRKEARVKPASRGLRRSSKGFVDRSKMLMGINFYGNDYSLPQGGGPIVGGEYISLLAKYKPYILWDPESQEHDFKYRKDGEKRIRNVVYYPSLKSLSDRLREAEDWGVGISIWEIGQGLDYFFDLL